MQPLVETLEARTLLSAWTYVVGRTFTGNGSSEAIELLGQRRILFVRCTFAGGSTDCRLNHCHFIGFYRCGFSDMRGPADPDGSGLQLIDSGDVTVTRCDFIASPFASDLLSNYADEPTAGTLTVRDCRFSGSGKANFSNAICLDGPFPPLTRVFGGEIVGSRCGITVASGILEMTDVVFKGCQTDTYVARLYGQPAKLVME